MCREMDEIYNEGAKLGEERGRIQGIAEGLAAGEMKKAKETALTLAEKGVSVADIADICRQPPLAAIRAILSGQTGTSPAINRYAAKGSLHE